MRATEETGKSRMGRETFNARLGFYRLAIAWRLHVCRMVARANKLFKRPLAGHHSTSSVLQLTSFHLGSSLRDPSAAIAVSWMTQPISPSAPSVPGSASPTPSAVSTPSTSSPSSSTSSCTAPDATTRCRYKTGRCSNARVVKPNGSLLLLCEFHRDQQNRTKKRSDMKYRHHRAKKRQMERLQPSHSHTPFSAMSSADAAQQPPQTTISLASSRPHIALPSPATTSTSPQTLSPIVSTPTMLSSSVCTDNKQPLHTPGSVMAKRESLSSCISKKSTLYKISSGLRSAAIGSRISPGKARMGALRSRALVGAFGVSRRDIVAMASPHKSHGPPSLPGPPGTNRSMPGMPLTPTVGAANTISLVTRTNVAAAQNRVNTSSYFLNEKPQPPMLQTSVAFPHASPPCLSPLRHNSSWAARGMSVWQPDDVRLLEYFIL